MATSSSEKKSKPKEISHEEILNQFQTLRAEQRNIANKLSEVKLEVSEYKLVINTLKEVEGDRKCFHSIGGVLCEKTVNEVLPKLIDTNAKLISVTESLEEMLTKKGIEITDFNTKHKLILRGSDEFNTVLEEAEKKNAGATNRSVVTPVQ